MRKTARKKIKKNKLTPKEFRQKLKLRHFDAKKKLAEKHPKIDKFFKEKSLDPGKIREHSAKIIGAGAITGALLLSPPSPTAALPSPDDVILKLDQGESGDEDEKINLTSVLQSILPEKPRPLERNEEKILESVFAQTFGIPAKASLEGEHLNTTYGYIGAEQHLRRFPGDTLLQHGEGEVLNEGLAPGLGAWGYFAPSRNKMTPYLEEIEKWYAVVQTLYLPDWNTRQPHLKNWYKYRKVLIVNTDNGKAVVAAISDSGPAAWTGKHFGGSPEVMDFLGGPKYKKGPVIVFFVDDPYNKVPLGPVGY